MTHRVWLDKCSLCQQEYKGQEWTFCSSAFHCCRVCVWYAGKRIVTCKECEKEEKHVKEQWEQDQAKEKQQKQ